MTAGHVDALRSDMKPQRRSGSSRTQSKCGNLRGGVFASMAGEKTREVLERRDSPKKRMLSTSTMSALRRSRNVDIARCFGAVPSESIRERRGPRAQRDAVWLRGGSAPSRLALRDLGEQGERREQHVVLRLRIALRSRFSTRQ
jgi:hypothetical protein